MAERQRVQATPLALEWIQRLWAQHGPLMFHQSGGCCDGSAPMCYRQGEFRIGARDVLLGELGGAPFWIGGDQYERWQHTDLIVDVVKGRGAGFSLEAPEGVRFLLRSELCVLPPAAEGQARSGTDGDQNGAAAPPPRR